MLRYLVAAYKATTRDSTFVEARDALLAVTAASDGADFQLFGQAFAKRGLGTGALAPDRFDPTNGQAPNPPLKESFFWGPDLYIQAVNFADSAVSCDSDGVLDRGEKGVLSLVLQNGGMVDLSHGTVTVSTAAARRHHRRRRRVPHRVDRRREVQDGADPRESGPGRRCRAGRGRPGRRGHRPRGGRRGGGHAAAERGRGHPGRHRRPHESVSTDDVEGTTSAWTAKSAQASNNPWIRAGVLAHRPRLVRRGCRPPVGRVADQPAAPGRNGSADPDLRRSVGSRSSRPPARPGTAWSWK